LFRLRRIAAGLPRQRGHCRISIPISYRKISGLHWSVRLLRKLFAYHILPCPDWNRDISVTSHSSGGLVGIASGYELEAERSEFEYRWGLVRTSCGLISNVYRGLFLRR
jgi:hypothetical protein